MTLLIDSEPTDIPRQPADTFKIYSQRLMVWLLERDKCIGSCKLDGIQVNTSEEAEEMFRVARQLEVDTIPVQIALQASIALQCNSMRKIESDCENLVTDSLLSEPIQVTEAWQELCQQVHGVIGFIPCLNALLTDEQIDLLVDHKFKDLNKIMTDISTALNQADVVTFSDILELRLLPWLTSLREFFQAQLPIIDTLGHTSPS